MKSVLCLRKDGGWYRRKAGWEPGSERISGGESTRLMEESPTRQEGTSSCASVGSINGWARQPQASRAGLGALADPKV